MWARFRRRRASGGWSAGLVLMYHGVGDVDIDPWGLFVSPSNFEAHLEILNAETQPVSLPVLMGQASQPSAPGPGPGSDRRKPMVAVTSDDGYANIARVASPLLERHDIPATLFAISAPLTEGGEYWWDELEAIILRPGPLPDRLDVEAADSRLSIRLGAAASYSVDQWHTDRRFRDGDHPGARMALYMQIWRELRDVEHRTRRRLLDRLRDWAGYSPGPRESHRNLTVDELSALDGDLVAIGGHTATHPLLPDLSLRHQRREILDNKRHLEMVLDRPVNVFSYPFGAHSKGTVTAVRAAGYDLAVTTKPETVVESTDGLRIGRFDVKNWDGDEFSRRLDEWWRR